ncbi:MAG: hypothetical protein J6Y72_08450 [Bacteroidales bacterium]|nr:hypothetical protein [Bacteroidales bacterium]
MEKNHEESFPLIEGENVLYKLKIDTYSYIIITNQRILEVRRSLRCCGIFEISKEVNVIMPESVRTIGYGRRKICCCFGSSYFLYYQVGTKKYTIKLYVSTEEEAAEIAEKFYETIHAVRVMSDNK